MSYLGGIFKILDKVVGTKAISVGSRFFLRLLKCLSKQIFCNMNINSTTLIFRIFFFVTCLYYAKADISRVLRSVDETALNKYKYIFYGVCHLNPVEHKILLTALIPYPPSPISDKDVKFLFFSRNNPLAPKVIVGNEPASHIANLNIDFRKETVIFCNGFLLPAIIPEIIFPNALLPQMDINIIITDWDSYIFYNLFYSTNVTTPLLGNVIGDFIEKLIDVGLDPKKTTLIGFSAGTQSVAVAAKRIRPKIARLIGFSPAGTCSNFQPNDQRLTIGDADYVVIVHTTTGFFEYSLNHFGDATFYINGGILQPFCAPIPSVLLQNFCGHFSGMIYLFISLWDTNILNGVKCDSYEVYKRSECDCDDTAALIYGIPSSIKGLYFVETNFPPQTLCLRDENNTSNLES